MWYQLVINDILELEIDGQNLEKNINSFKIYIIWS